jgi:uridine kinase
MDADPLMTKVNLPKMIAERVPKVGNSLFISIDGRGGSGKSTLARWLSEKLGVQIVETDDFATWENPFDWWPLVIEQVFRPIQNGAKTLSHFRPKRREIAVPVTEVMFLEGVSASRREFRPYLSLSIFVDAPRALSLQRGIERDVLKGQTRDQLEELWAGWVREEDKYLERDHPERHADLTVVGTKPFEEQLSLE